MRRRSSKTQSVKKKKKWGAPKKQQLVRFFFWRKWFDRNFFVCQKLPKQNSRVQTWDLSKGRIRAGCRFAGRRHHGIPEISGCGPVTVLTYLAWDEKTNNGLPEFLFDMKKKVMRIHLKKLEAFWKCMERCDVLSFQWHVPVHYYFHFPAFQLSVARCLSHTSSQRYKTSWRPYHNWHLFRELVRKGEEESISTFSKTQLIWGEVSFGWITDFPTEAEWNMPLKWPTWWLVPQ